MAWCGLWVLALVFWHCHQTRESKANHCVYMGLCVWGLSGGSERTDSNRTHTHTLGHSDTSSITHVLWLQTHTTNMHSTQQEDRGRIEMRKEKKLTPLSSSERKSGPSSSPSCCGETHRKIRTNDRNVNTTDARYYSTHRRILGVNNKGGGSEREKHPPSWLLRVEYECGGVCVTSLGQEIGEVEPSSVQAQTDKLLNVFKDFTFTFEILLLLFVCILSYLCV